MPIRQVLSDTRVPVKIWTMDVDQASLDQVRKSANLPFVFKWLAVMPDVHPGKGSTIGTVIATRGAIVPACVGVDLGCGMQAVKTSLKLEQLDGKLARLRSLIEGAVPTGSAGHAESKLDRLPRATCENLGQRANDILRRDKNSAKLEAAIGKWTHQMGSLGSGNHFIEVCRSEKDEVWVVLHSGSRGVGNLIAQHHMSIARGVMKQMFIALPDPDLSYLVEGTLEYDKYVNDMMWAQEFALHNRSVMMSLVLEQMRKMMGPFSVAPEIDCHHNYVSRENHYGENVLVTRKGAVRARRGDLGIIPRSMGARSFIVRGLGNPESFDSCSHGAGRKMSRTAARKTFSASDLRKQTAGVECRKDEAVLDEIPGAYKDIDAVMENQADLVEPIEVLKQVLCVKGA